MSVEHVEVIVEEPSMEGFLRAVLPRILGPVALEVYAHSCKQELLDRLPERLRGYATWLPEAWRILVVVDRDDDDCEELKQRLDDIARDAGLRPRADRGERGGLYRIVNRLAIEELEAWYFGDWEAVRTVYPRVPATIPKQAKYRDPDAIRGGTWEAFERILQRAGYMKGGLRKIETARAIAAHVLPERSRSRSFRALADALRTMQS